MTMARGVSEIDRLIEEGLSLYGEGDLDGALLLWERVLVMDPDNPQANSYVDYVRMNYELLTSDNHTEDSGPFGIGSDEPEYQIEILAGDSVPPAPAAPLLQDDRGHGWGIDDHPDQPGPSLPGALTLELEADEPPPEYPATFESKTGEGLSFEEATREYPGGKGRPARALLADQPADPEFPAEVTPPGFGPEDFHTPAGFGSQTTDIRRRDLGFVQPARASERREPGRDPGGDTGPPELKMTLRTPGSTSPASPPPPPRPADPRGASAADGDDEDHTTVRADRLELDLMTPVPAADLASAYASLELDLPPVPAKGTEDLAGRADTRPAVPGSEAAAAALIDSLPTPRPPVSTRPMPTRTRPPAFGAEAPGPPAAPSAAGPTAAGADDERATRDLTLEPTDPSLPAAPTQELPYVMKLDPRLAIHPDPQQAPTATRDFAEKPTNQIPSRRRSAPPVDPTPRDRPAPIDPTGEDPRPAGRAAGGPTPRDRPAPIDSSLITAPTRELGLRNNDRRAATEDETTGQVDVYRVRAARSNGKPEILGMDPIDARSAEILDQIDGGAPAIETREERTRRRITALLERAAAWGRDADVERAVTAVDLALSEDPNSALAQKLIHRNRETIMTAFQSFLGDLQRTPSLARPLHELGSAPISPRAAFLLSRVDGTLSLDEILDVSGMPRLEAYRYLCQLFLRGILR